MRLLVVSVWILVWSLGFFLSVKIEFGLVYIILSGFLGIYLGLDKTPKKPGAPSAYSVFNKDCQPVPGSMSLGQMESTLLGRRSREEIAAEEAREQAKKEKKEKEARQRREEVAAYEREVEEQRQKNLRHLETRQQHSLVQTEASAALLAKLNRRTAAIDTDLTRLKQRAGRVPTSMLRIE